MAKKKTKPASKPETKRAPLKRTLDDKLRTVVNLKIANAPAYTQKELAAILGISERTIRRYKNQKGYALASTTVARIKTAVEKQDRQIRRELQKGTAFRIESVKVSKTKKKRLPRRVKGAGLRLPPSRILQFPVIHPSKSGETQTLAVNCEGWDTQAKIEYLESAQESKRFQSWHARVMVPPGVSKSGRKDSPQADESINDEEDEESGKVEKEFYMIGPFDLVRNRSKIKSEIRYHEDAGRVVVEIFIVEKLK